VANKGYVQTLLNAVPSEFRTQLQAAFDYVQDNWRLGDGARATNAQLYKFEGTTAAVAGEEFSIRHGMGQAPTKLIPVLNLNSINSQIVPLVVSRAPDAQRIYLTSSSTSAAFEVYVEV
jgi:hypothetical protein